MKTVVILMAASVCLSATTSAQETGSRLPGSSGRMVSSYGYPADDEIGARPADEAVKVARAMARCVVTSKRADVDEYLGSRDDNSRHASYARLSGVMSTCMSNVAPGAVKFQMSASSLNGALAEASMAGHAMPALAAKEPSTTETPYWLSTAADQRVVQEMAICLVNRYPQQSSALIGSASGSASEQAAFSALAPMMGPCLVSGASLRANRSGVRLALVAAMYHRIHDPAEPASAEKK